VIYSDQLTLSPQPSRSSSNLPPYHASDSTTTAALDRRLPRRDRPESVFQLSLALPARQPLGEGLIPPPAASSPSPVATFRLGRPILRVINNSPFPFLQDLKPGDLLSFPSGDGACSCRLSVIRLSCHIPRRHIPATWLRNPRRMYSLFSDCSLSGPMGDVGGKPPQCAVCGGRNPPLGHAELRSYPGKRLDRDMSGLMCQRIVGSIGQISL
jgi:hypothetical protein